VIGVDVGDHRHHRLQVEEGSVGLVRFHYDELARSEPRVGSRRLQPPADHEGRVETTFREHACHEAGRRGLAVGAGDRDALPQPHQLGEHERARHNRDLLCPCRYDFRILVPDRARGDDSISAGDVLLGVTDMDLGAELAQPPRGRGLGEIGAAHLVAQRQQHLRDAAHASAAYAYEVHVLDLVSHDKRFFLPPSAVRLPPCFMRPPPGRCTLLLLLESPRACPRRAPTAPWPAAARASGH
jgi:hypothetical protein